MHPTASRSVFPSIPTGVAAISAENCSQPHYPFFHPLLSCGEYLYRSLDRVADLVTTTNQEIESYRQTALEAKKRELRDITDIGGCFIQLQYDAAKRGEIAKAVAKERAIEGMRMLRYGKDDYLWISDFDAVLISHPDPKLFGADFSKIKDVNGNLIVPPMVAVAREHGQGYVSYWWHRLGHSEPSEKLTFSKLFEPWQWVYGSGVYTDDITDEVNLRRETLIDRLRTLMGRITIAQTGYMFIFDDQMKMIIHPNRQMEGKNFASVPNPLTGRPLVDELIRAAMSMKKSARCATSPNLNGISGHRCTPTTCLTNRGH